MIETLLQRIAHGDARAFEDLYRAWRPRLTVYAAGLLAGDRQAAEDAVDEAFAAVWKQAARQDPKRSAQAWLRAIVRNKAIDHLRQERDGRSGSGGIDPDIEGIADNAAGPAELAELNSQSKALRGALVILSVEQREAVWLCYFEELPLQTIAELAACPVNTIKTRLYHARRILRQSGLLDGV